MKKRTKYIGNLIRNNIHETDPNAHVILYGSRARSEERPDSDWDILVLTDYAVNALLVQNEIYAQSHAGTKNQFSLLFIKTKKIDLKYGKLFSELFDWRQKGDYENLFDYDAESVEPLFKPVLELIELIEKEVKSPYNKRQKIIAG